MGLGGQSLLHPDPFQDRHDQAPCARATRLGAPGSVRASTPAGADLTSLALLARARALSPLMAAWPYPQGRTWETGDHDRPSTALAARLLRARFRRSRTRPGGWAPADAGRAGRRLPPAARRARARTRPGPTSARPLQPHLLRPAPPNLRATTTGCATSRTSSPPSPTARGTSASTWTDVVAGPAPASDIVFLYGVP